MSKPACGWRAGLVVWARGVVARDACVTVFRAAASANAHGAMAGADVVAAWLANCVRDTWSWSGEAWLSISETSVYVLTIAETDTPHYTYGDSRVHSARTRHSDSVDPKLTANTRTQARTGATA